MEAKNKIRSKVGANLGVRVYKITKLYLKVPLLSIGAAKASTVNLSLPIREKFQ